MGIQTLLDPGSAMAQLLESLTGLDNTANTRFSYIKNLGDINFWAGRDLESDSDMICETSSSQTQANGQFPPRWQLRMLMVARQCNADLVNESSTSTDSTDGVETIMYDGMDVVIFAFAYQYIL